MLWIHHVTEALLCDWVLMAPEQCAFWTLGLARPGRRPGNLGAIGKADRQESYTSQCLLRARPLPPGCLVLSWHPCSDCSLCQALRGTFSVLLLSLLHPVSHIFQDLCIISAAGKLRWPPVSL